MGWEEAATTEGEETMKAALSRGEVLRRAAVGGAAILSTGALLATTAHAAPSRAQDVPILANLLWLEYLQAELYAQAAQAASIGPDLLAFARAAGPHEHEHIATLRALLGPAAADPPRLDLAERTTDGAAFTDTAILLEDLGVRVFNGHVAALTPRALAQAARIASVDARHAAWIRGLAGISPSHDVFDTGRSVDDVADILAGAGLVTGPRP